MAEIEYWMMSAPTASDLWERALQDFKTQTGIRVNLRVIPWETAWSELVKVAIYKHGPDVSEIGSTWLSSLVSMNALHQFTKAEIDGLGGNAAFVGSSWQSTSIAGDSRIWAVPYIADTRLLYYRRDLLQKAGIDENNAFQTHANLVATLERLQASGLQAPWTVPTQRTLLTLHNAASWVWGAGGSLTSPDGRKPAFQEKTALKGWTEYFSLRKFLGPGVNRISESQSDASYWSGQSAVTITGPWLLREKATPPEVVKNSGIRLPPGMPYVGGSNLVIWQHSRRHKESMALVRFLTGLKAQSEYLPKMALLPVNQQALKAPIIAEDWIYQKMIQSLQMGRTFQLVPMWGLVEDRLGDVLSQIWNEIYDHPEFSIARTVEDYMSVLASQLEPALIGR